MLQILSKMFEFFKSKTKRLQDKIDKYIELENDRSVLKFQIDELADFFYERKTVRDSIVKSETDQEVIKSVEDRFDNFVSSHIVEIGDLKRRRDKIDQEMNNLIKGDEEFLNLVKSERENRKYKTILSKYRSEEIELSVCDNLLKAVSKKKVSYADNLVFNEKGQLLLLKRSEVVDFKPGHYTIPGGHVDLGEAFETAAKRELLEEAGIKSENVTEVGVYENEDVRIHYFRSDVVNVEPLLQEEEIWSYGWVDPKELDKYLMMENMRDNINKILYPFKHQVNKINKSFESGLINDKQRDMLLSNVIEKAKQSFKNDKTEDDISVDKFFENKFEDKYKVFYEAVKKYLWDKWGIKSKKDFDDKFSDEAKLKEVDIDDICPTQKYVSKKILDEKMENDHFKTSKIQLLKFDGKYFLYDGHHRTCAFIEEGYKTVKEDVLKLNKIKDFEKDIEEYLPKEFDLYNIIDKAEDSDIEKASDYYKELEKIKEEILEEKQKKELDKSDFLDVWKRFMTSKNSEGVEEYNEYGNHHKLADITYWPKGLDLENCETVYLDKEKIIVVAGGDWQDGMYVTIGLSKNSTGYDCKLEVIGVSDKKPAYKQSSRDRMKFRKENGLVKSEFDNLNKALDDNLINESQYNILLEKAWKKQQIGTVVTHKDGKKYRKVSETGNRDQDWQLVSKDKTRTAKPESNRNSEAKQQEGVDNKDSKENLQESAKNASETALNNAIQHSSDPEVRTTAHEELDRREKEEKPKEEIKDDKSGVDNKEKKQESKFTEQFRNLTDSQLEFYLSAPMRDVSKAAEEVLTERGVDFISKDNIDKMKLFIRESGVNVMTLSKTFGGESEYETIKNIYGFLGGVDNLGKINNLEFSPSKKDLQVSLESDKVSMERFYNAETKEVDHFSLHINKKGEGLGTKIFNSQVESYRKQGYKIIRTTAQKSSGTNGYYTWARLGFEHHSGDSFRILDYIKQSKLDQYSDNVKNAKSVSELMSFPEGRDFWREYGETFEGTFDLSDNSKSMFILNKYIGEKKNAKK